MEEGERRRKQNIMIQPSFSQKKIPLSYTLMNPLISHPSFSKSSSRSAQVAMARGELYPSIMIKEIFSSIPLISARKC